jgi:hypothetical protein
MKTYEMYAKAIEDGKTYRASDMFYNNVKGFHDDEGYIWSWEAYSHHRDGYDAFLSEDGWEEVVEERVFTLEEIKKYLLEFKDKYFVSQNTESSIVRNADDIAKFIFSRGRRV